MIKEKGRAFARPVGTSSAHEVSYNYFGWVAGAFGAVVAGAFGVVVAGRVAGVVGFVPAGLAGAGTPDCAL